MKLYCFFYYIVAILTSLFKGGKGFRNTILLEH
jgi:hypothetical protein